VLEKDLEDQVDR